jgi:hypothetical protein
VPADADPEDAQCLVTEAYGIFVSASAQPGGTGTRTAPVQTIALGIAQAVDEGLSRVYVCGGAYAEQVVLDGGDEGTCGDIVGGGGGACGGCGGNGGSGGQGGGGSIALLVVRSIVAVTQSALTVGAGGPGGAGGTGEKGSAGGAFGLAVNAQPATCGECAGGVGGAEAGGGGGGGGAGGVSIGVLSTPRARRLSFGDDLCARIGRCFGRGRPTRLRRQRNVPGTVRSDGLERDQRRVTIDVLVVTKETQVLRRGSDPRAWIG